MPKAMPLYHDTALVSVFLPNGKAYINHDWRKDEARYLFCIMETGPKGLGFDSHHRLFSLVVKKLSMYATTGVSASSGTAFHSKSRGCKNGETP